MILLKDRNELATKKDLKIFLVRLGN